MSIKITLLRHAESYIAAGLPDRERSITMTGIEQSLSRRRPKSEPDFDLVCHSGTARSRETALFVSSVSDGKDMVEVPELFGRDDDPRIITFVKNYGELGHVPLAEYYKRMRQELHGLGLDAWTALRREILKRGATDILAVGHGITLCALAATIAGARQEFLERALDHCEGFELTVEDARANLARCIP